MTGRQRAAALLGGVALAILVAGCETYTVAPPTFDSPLDVTAQAIALERYATQSAAEVQAVEAQAQATVQAAIYAATLQAVEAQREQEREWATAQAAQVTAQAEATRQTWAMEATAGAWQATATAEVLAGQATATAQAWERETTATAEARYWQATQQAAQATQAAEATAGALAYQATVTRQAWEAKTTATAESVQATQAAYQATATRAAEQREVVLGYGRDYGLPALLLAFLGCAVALVVYAIRQHGRRPVVIERDFRGDARPMAVPVKGGGWTFVDLDRQPGPALTTLPSGAVSAPQLRTPGQEERTTARDQMVDGATRPRLGAGQRATGAPALPLAPPPTPPAPGLRSVAVLRRLDQAATAGVLSPALVATLQADWEEAE